MNADRRQQISRLYQAALARQGAERAAFLADACRGDDPLRQVLSSLLEQPASAQAFLDAPALAPAAQLASDVDASLVGRRLGAYQIQAHLGAGGMGEVYRARDTKLGRDVAIKILPRGFTSDPERLARFDREARMLAALNHPHIGAIYGLEDADGMRALVLELVEGETLASRIARGPLTVKDALPIARQIAEALEAAHDKGIVHRDLKPANVALTREGTVKVLDFGLAKAVSVDAPAPDLTRSPTVSAHGTRDGVILGTAAYMSPEQAKGKPVDDRADIWAFGCVLYEMLVGRPAFGGDSVADIVAAVIEREPSWDALPGVTPQAIQRLLRRCLQKDQKRRLRNIGDAALDIDDALAAREQIAVGVHAERPGHGWLRTTALVLLAFGFGAVSVWVSRTRSTPESGVASVGGHEIRFQVYTPPTTEPASIALSPDGTKLAFVATADERSQLWLRAIDAVTARPLPGTENGVQPFWSPDSGSIGFFADGQLKRINLQDSVVQVLASAPASRGAAWARDGTILFQRSPGMMPLLRLASTGGAPVLMEATRPGARFPSLLPDGRHFVYRAGSEVFVGDLNGSNTRQLFDADSTAVFAPPGHLIFVRQGTLFALAFDPARLQAVGSPTAVAADMSVSQPLGLAPISASNRDGIAYRTGSAGGLRQFVWIDRAGKPIGRVGEAVPSMLAPTMSPDGRFVSVHRAVLGNSDIWVLDVQRGVISRFTSSARMEFYPLWSIDGRKLFFNSGGDIYEKSLDAANSDRLVKELEREASPMDLSPDGRYLVCLLAEPAPQSDLWAVPITSEEQPFPVAATSADERDAKFAPDGKWIAYQSDESGRYEVYVQPFPGPGIRHQISSSGGAMVRWRSDGKELFYIALDGRLMAVPIRISMDSATLEPGTAQPLFPTRVGGALQGNSWAQYIPSPDGQRFLMNTLVEEAAAPITVILNWRPK